MRLNKLIKKEFKEIMRDRGFILTLIFVPIITMFVFGYTFQADIDSLDTIVINKDYSMHSTEVIEAVDNSEYFKRIDFSGDLEQAKELLKKSKVRAVFYIPSDFSARLDNATRSHIELYLDSSDYTIYNILKGASAEVIKGSLQDIVSLIIKDMEEERDANQKKVDEIDSLIDSLESKAIETRERTENIVSQLGSTKSLLDDTESKLELTEAEVNKINNEIVNLKSEIQESLDSINELKADLIKIKEENQLLNSTIVPILEELTEIKSKTEQSLAKIDDLEPASRIDTSKEYYNIGELKSKVNKNEEEVKDINSTTHELEGAYGDIQERIDGITIELKSLKKEFLSLPLELKREYIFNEVSYFQYLTPAIITLALFFIGFVLTIINIVDERNQKTLFRIATTPLKKHELFLGKFSVFFATGIFESFYIVAIAVYIFNVPIAGSLMNVFIVTFLLMATSLGIGLLFSVMVKTMRQALMLIPLVVIPFILISQTFSPIEVMPDFMRQVAFLSPMYYSNAALRDIMIKGSALSDVSFFVFVLLAYAVLAVASGILISKKRIE